MTSFSSRERVLAAIAHQEPDRVPLALWGSWFGVTDPLYFDAMAHLGWEPVPPFRPERLHSVNFYDDRLLAHLGVDIRHVDPGVTVATSRTDADGFDAWGLKWQKVGLYRGAAVSPLEHATVDEIMAYPLPGPDATVDAAAIQARVAAIKALDGEYAVAGRAVASYGLFEMAQSLRKHEQLLMDMVLAPEIVTALVDRLTDCYAAFMARFLEIAGPSLDLLELPGDDFAGNNGLIISPAMFAEFFQEPYRRLIAGIKAQAPHIKVVFHSDGAMAPLLPTLADLGVDVFHPLEPLPATDMAAVKRDVGARLTFMGGIDIRTTMQGPPAGIVAEVQQRMRELAPGGGYILAPANHLQSDVPAANLFALYAAAQEHGRYPFT